MRISLFDKLVMLGLLLSTFVIVLSLPAGASEVSIISDIQLKSLLDNPEVVIIDVRGSKDWQSSNFKIKGAVRKIPKQFESWAHDFSTDKELILY
ncbi:MAG: hypothetical protein MUO88_03675 [Desulfobacterales bacterium]|nr:hypothetical protein [Desulfobacterales bacterium]